MGHRGRVKSELRVVPGSFMGVESDYGGRLRRSDLYLLDFNGFRFDFVRKSLLKRAWELSDTRCSKSY